MGNIISYYSGDQEFRIGYPSGGSIITQIYQFRLRSVDFSASNAVAQYGWDITSEDAGGGLYDVTFSFKPYGTPANFDLVSFPQDSYRLAWINIPSTITDTVTIDWWTDKDSNVFDTSTNNTEGILFVKSGNYAGAGGDPHIKPLMGSGYDLPHVEDTFLLYSNNNVDYPVTVKTKCWFLPKEKYERYIHKMNQNGYTTRAAHYKRIFERGTYFKYLEIVSGEEHIIFDMESLSMCEFTCIQDVDTFILPSKKHYDGHGAVRIGKIKKSKKGILGKRASPNTLERTVYVYSPKATISLRLLKDSRNLTTRNGVEFFINKGFYADTGAFIRKDIIYSEFGSNYGFVPGGNHESYEESLPSHDGGKAISYGNLTEENINQYSYESIVSKNTAMTTEMPRAVENYSYDEECDMRSLLETNTEMMLEDSDNMSVSYDMEMPVIDLAPKQEIVSKKQKKKEQEQEREREREQEQEQEQQNILMAYDYDDIVVSMAKIGKSKKAAKAAKALKKVQPEIFESISYNYDDNDTNVPELVTYENENNMNGTIFSY